MTSTSANAALEVAPDEGAHLLRLQVVGVVVARRESTNVPSRMRRFTSAPKPASRVAPYISRRSRRVLDAQAVADAVEAREVARRLGRRDDVVGRDGERVCGSFTRLHRAAVALEARDGRAHARRDLGVEPLGEVLLGHADAQAADARAARAS